MYISRFLSEEKHLHGLRLQRTRMQVAVAAARLDTGRFFYDSADLRLCGIVLWSV